MYVCNIWLHNLHQVVKAAIGEVRALATTVEAAIETERSGDSFNDEDEKNSGDGDGNDDERSDECGLSLRSKLKQKLQKRCHPIN